MPAYPTDSTGMAVNFEGKPPAGLRADALVARATIEARNYSLLNPYLSDRQKAIVEVWYQLPIVAFTYSCISVSNVPAFLPIRPVFCAIYFSLIVGWIVTVAANEVILEPLVPILAIGNNTLILFSLLLLVGFTGAISWPSAIGLAIVSITGVPNPGTQLATAWAVARYPRLNPKYGAAKIIFRNKGGVPEFAFERYLEDGETKALDVAAAQGKTMLCWISLGLLIFATYLWG